MRSSWWWRWQRRPRHRARHSALSHVFGYAAGNDLTRRDLQSVARRARPALGYRQGLRLLRAACGTSARWRPAAILTHGRIWLKVNGVQRQESDVSQMLWDVPHIIAALSRLYELRAGDLIFTGTPAGVGALKVGDRIEGGIEGLEVLRHSIGAPATD